MWNHQGGYLSQSHMQDMPEKQREKVPFSFCSIDKKQNTKIVKELNFADNAFEEHPRRKI